MPGFFPRAVGMDSFTAAGDSGGGQVITDGNTLTIAGGTGLTSVDSATDTITLNLDNTAVTPATYTLATVTVDQQGRITSASSGTAGANTALSNLASVAINTALVSDTHNTDDLGTDTISWKTLYLATSLVFDQTTRNLTITASEPATSARTVNFPDPGANESVVYLAANQALTTKTYDGLTIATGVNTFTLTRGTGSLDVAAGVVVDINGNLTVESASLVNQDLTTDANVIFATATLNNTGLHVLDTNASHDLIIAPGSDITADRTLTVTTGDADRTLTLSGDLTVEAASLVNQDLTSDATVTFAGVISSGTAGYDATPGSDVDTDLLTVNVTGTPRMFWDESEDYFALTKSLQLPSGGNIKNGTVNTLRSIIIPAAAMKQTTTAGCAALATIEAATNDVDYNVLDFDQTTAESAFFIFPLPDSYDGSTITFKFIWTAAAGTGTFILGLKGRAYANDDAIDAAYGTEVTATDTLIATGDVHISPVSGAVTLAGSPAGGQLVQCKVTRDVANDTLNADARLIAVVIEYGVSAFSD